MRRLTLAITPQGRNLIRSVTPESQHVTAQIDVWFGTDHLASLLQLLDRLSQFPPE